MNCKTIVQIEANWIQYEKLKFNKREMAFSGKFHQNGWMTHANRGRNGHYTKQKR